MSNHNVPAGWYRDPDGKPSERYWDGQKWSTESRPISTLSNKPAPQVSKGGLDQNETAILWFIGIAVILVIIFSI